MHGAVQSGRWRGYIVLSLAWIALFGGFWLFSHRAAPQPVEIVPPPTVTVTAQPPVTPTASALRVDVAGAVSRPGVYRLARGSIVADAIAAAGGPAADADLDRLNKAAPVQDAGQVYVPVRGETLLALPAAAAATGQPAGTPAPASVNVNTASLSELDQLPGIGPQIAQRIVDGRPYASVDDLERVPGIGPATVARLRPFVTVK